MKRKLDYDPYTGITTWHHYDEHTDTTTIYDEADLDPLHRKNYELRKEDDYSKQGIKNEHWHYASIHPIEQQKMMAKYGVDVFNKDQSKEVMKILNTDPEFQRCKTTTGHHA